MKNIVYESIDFKSTHEKYSMGVYPLHEIRHDIDTI